MPQNNMKKEEIFVLNSGDLDLEKIEVKGQSKVFLKTTITTGDKDLVNDIVTEKCMESMIRQLKDRTIKLDFEHEAFRGESLTETEMAKTRIPLGKRVSFERGMKGVDVTWELNPNWKKFDSKGDVVYDFKSVVENVEGKFYDGTSIAYIPTKTKQVKSNDGSDIRLLDDVTLLNVALTGNPVNTHASVNEIFMKSLDYLKKSSGEKEDEEEDEEELKKKKCPKKKSHLIKFNQEAKMSEEQEAQEKPEAEAPAEAEAKEPEQKDEPAKPEAEAEAEAPVEAEGGEGEAEVKALKKQVDAQAKEIQELKAALEKPQVKGKQEQMKASKTEAKAIEPLDLIA